MSSNQSQYYSQAGRLKGSMPGDFPHGDEDAGGDPGESGLPEPPNIFEYHDFRKYLGDLFVYRHCLNPKFNKSYVCKQMGLINSRSYFKAVLNGRIVSKSKVEDFIRTFELGKVEAQYFRVLVNFNQDTGFRGEREWHLEQLQALKDISQRRDNLHTDKGCHKVWYCPAVRAILSVKDIRDEFGYLGNLIIPPISAQEAEEAVLSLFRMGLIRKDDQGRWKPVENPVPPRP